MPDDNLACWVYRSPRTAEMYLYLAEPDSFDRIPKELLRRFGEPVLVIELELDPERKLAREDVNQVIANLRSQGFHLQLPPELTPALYHGNAD